MNRQLLGPLRPTGVLLPPSPRIYEQFRLGREFTVIRLTRNVDLEDAVFRAPK